MADEKGIVWTANGGCSANSTDGLVLDGTNDYISTTAAQSALTLSDDFTVELFVKSDTFAIGSQIVINTAWSGTGGGFFVDLAHSSVGAGKPSLWLDSWSGGSAAIASATPLSTGVLNYLALKRSGDVFSLWANGTQLGTRTGNYGISKAVQAIGGYNGDGGPLYYCDCNIKAARITKGVARDVSVTPTLPFWSTNPSGWVAPTIAEQETGAGQTIGSASFFCTASNAFVRASSKTGSWMCEIDLIAFTSSYGFIYVATAGSGEWFNTAQTIVYNTSRAGAAGWYSGQEFSFGGESGSTASWVDATTPTLPCVLGIVFNSTTRKVSMYVDGVRRFTHTLAAATAGKQHYPVFASYVDDTGSVVGTFRTTPSSYATDYVYPT
jgi:hypothetical protein